MTENDDTTTQASVVQAARLVEQARRSLGDKHHLGTASVDFHLLVAADALQGVAGAYDDTTHVVDSTITDTLLRATRLLDGLPTSDRHVLPVVVARSHLRRALRALPASLASSS